MYRPGRLRPKPPKLDGVISRTVLLEMAWRHVDGQTSPRNVTACAEGLVFLDVGGIGLGGSCLWPIVEVSPDVRRWADHVIGPPLTEPGFYRLPVSNLGAFLRVSYRLQGSMAFSLEWVGKSYLVISENPRDVLTRR